jgi:hypothetical protein
MKRAILLLLLFSLLYADFRLENLDVKISNIEKDGSASIQENIKLIMIGNSSIDLYASGYLGNNTLAFWSGHTGLSEVKQHVNTAKVVIRDFRLQPQPQTGCNPFLNLCRGELRLSYKVSPIYNFTNPEKMDMVNKTGLFIVDKYKPRTRRYFLTPEALNFPMTEQGNIVLNDNIYLTIVLPEDSRIAKEGDINPLPQGFSQKIPGYVDRLTWNDMVLAKFSLIYEVEDGLDKEVADFFSSTFFTFQSTVQSSHGLSLLLVIAILVGSYIYINLSKKKREE